jgi:hypothetical protein
MAKINKNSLRMNLIVIIDFKFEITIFLKKNQNMCNRESAEIYLVICNDLNFLCEHYVSKIYLSFFKKLQI